MNKLQLRESFEKWAKRINVSVAKWTSTDCYVEYPTRVAWVAYQAAFNMQQAEIDRLTLEHCPDEMAQEQMEEWGNSQRRVAE